MDQFLNDKVVVLWSGGIDSTGLIFILLSKYLNCQVYPIFVKHGQRNLLLEEKSVREYSQNFQTMFKSRFHSPFVVTSDIPAQEFKKIKSENRSFLRNSDLINNAVRFALDEKIKIILIATFTDDLLDGRKEYLIAKENEIEKGINEKLHVLSPFHHENFEYFSKSDVIKFCNKKGFDLIKTRSCYESSEKPCGKCDSCKKRERALITLGDW